MLRSVGCVNMKMFHDSSKRPVVNIIFLARIVHLETSNEVITTDLLIDIKYWLTIF